MELTGKYRHELKYSISLADRMALVQRLLAELEQLKPGEQ